jgi:sulfite oxidase
VFGYALSGGGCRITRVEVTADGGRSWTEAELKQEDVMEPRHYGWTLWRAVVEVPKGANEVEVWSRAVDSSGNVQPETMESVWNLRGFLPNAYCRRKYKVT